MENKKTTPKPLGFLSANSIASRVVAGLIEHKNYMDKKRIIERETNDCWISGRPYDFHSDAVTKIRQILNFRQDKFIEKNFVDKQAWDKWESNTFEIILSCLGRNAILVPKLNYYLFEAYKNRGYDKNILPPLTEREIIIQAELIEKQTRKERIAMQEVLNSPHLLEIHNNMDRNISVKELYIDHVKYIIQRNIRDMKDKFIAENFVDKPAWDKWKLEATNKILKSIYSRKNTEFIKDTRDFENERKKREGKMLGINNNNAIEETNNNND